MGKVVETAPPVPVVVEEQPTPVADPPRPTTLISLEQLQQIDAAESAAERVERLQVALGVQHYPANPRTSVWVDFCFGVLNFARDEALLPPEKTLCLLTLANDVYVFATQLVSEPELGMDLSVEKVIEPVPISTDETVELQQKIASEMASFTSPGAYPTVEAVYDHFKDKIRHASGVVTNNDNAQDRTRSDISSSLTTPFSPTQVARIVTFFTSTFFRHLRAYQYVSRVPRPSIVRESPLSTETPLPPAPLVDAIQQAE